MRVRGGALHSLRRLLATDRGVALLVDGLELADVGGARRAGERRDGEQLRDRAAGVEELVRQDLIESRSLRRVVVQDLGDQVLGLWVGERL